MRTKGGGPDAASVAAQVFFKGLSAPAPEDGTLIWISRNAQTVRDAFGNILLRGTVERTSPNGNYFEEKFPCARNGLKAVGPWRAASAHESNNTSCRRY